MKVHTAVNRECSEYLCSFSSEYPSVDLRRLCICTCCYNSNISYGGQKHRAGEHWQLLLHKEPHRGLCSNGAIFNKSLLDCFSLRSTRGLASFTSGWERKLCKGRFNWTRDPETRCRQIWWPIILRIMSCVNIFIKQSSILEIWVCWILCFGLSYKNETHF